MSSKKEVIEKIRARLAGHETRMPVSHVTLSREEALTLVKDEDLRNEQLAEHADKWT